MTGPGSSSGLNGAGRPGLWNRFVIAAEISKTGPAGSGTSISSRGAWTQANSCCESCSFNRFPQKGLNACLDELKKARFVVSPDVVETPGQFAQQTSFENPSTLLIAEHPHS